jgi:SAM-dependent methyltransferase
LRLNKRVDSVTVPDEIVARVANGIGLAASKLSRVDPLALSRDFLNVDKSGKRLQILSRYIDPKGKRILEVGCGYGTNLIAWTRQFQLDVTGVEPEGEGFPETISISTELCRLNGVPADRIKHSTGEKLPFDDASFDIIYSANVLEHTVNPAGVLRECARVLRPGGIIHFELPNFLSFFEGHYCVLIPPLWWKGLLAFVVRYIYGRDPAFAGTLKTEINPIWCRRTISDLKKEYRLELISLGEELFQERLNAHSFQFEHQVTASKVGRLIGLLLKLNKGNFIANTFILIQAHYPIYLTVRKDEVNSR